MKDWLLQLLRDPVDGRTLTRDGEELVSPSGRRYPIVRGIPRFVPSDSYAGSFGYQWNQFARTQLDSESGRPESRNAFLQKTGLRLEDLAGKTVLDVGCGMGRFAEVVAEAGARLVGIDLSVAVDAAGPNLARFENAAVVQADVFALPFAPETFEVIYSIGVLHHTPDTREAFLALPRLLKPGGQIAVWLYTSFLRWTHLTSRLYRKVTTHLPKALLLKLCRVAVPLGAIQRSGGKAGLVLRWALPVSGHPDPEWRILDTFDWYSPRYQWTHTEAEVDGWFLEAGLTDLWHGTYPVSVRGKRA